MNYFEYFCIQLCNLCKWAILPRMPEQLITIQQLAAKLGISVRTLDRIRPMLIAGGLQVIKLPSSRGGKPLIRFREASVDAEIVKAAQTGLPPWSRRRRNSGNPESTIPPAT